MVGKYFYPYLMAQTFKFTKYDKYFDDFVMQMETFVPRPEIKLEEVPAPQKLAPRAYAVVGDVALDENDDVATGRFVLLLDPEGQEAWDGNFRCVTFVRAAIDSEMASDPMLAEVGWSWFLESLSKAGADFCSPSGTVTRVASKSFGQLVGTDDGSEIEIRASWTPTEPSQLMFHAKAWMELLAVTSGLAPLPEGVSSLGQNRR